MKKFAGLVVLTGLLAFVGVQDAAAQTLYLSGGVSVPTGDYKTFTDDADDGAKTGWLGMAGANFRIGENGLFVGGGAFYGSNSHEAEGDKTNLLGGFGLVGFMSFGTLRGYRGRREERQHHDCVPAFRDREINLLSLAGSVP